MPFASLSSPSDEAFASDDGVSEYALSPDVVTPSPAVAGSQAAAYASQPFGNAHPLARAISPCAGLPFGMTALRGTPRVRRARPRSWRGCQRGPGGGVEKDAASGKGDGEAKRTSAADAPAAAAKAHPQPSAPVSRRGIGLMARASSRPPPNAAASALLLPPPSGSLRPPLRAAQISRRPRRRSRSMRQRRDAAWPGGVWSTQRRRSVAPKSMRGSR